MIRSTLFKSLAPALRDSLSDAEVCVLGMWLLASTGTYPTRGVSIYAKDERGTAAIEDAVKARYTYPEDIAQDVALAGGSINETFRLPAAGNLAHGSSISGIEDLMYTVTRSNQEQDVLEPPNDAAAAPQPEVPVPAWARNTIAQAPPPRPELTGRQNLDRLREQPIPQWLNEQPAVEIPEPVRGRVFEQRAVDRLTELERMDDMMLERLRELRAVEERRREEMARVTRGIPNRR